MRLIDADALYRKVKTECNPYGKPTIGFEDGNRVMNWIEQAPTVSGWVSVKDRLPEKDGVYLVYCDRESVFSAWYERGREHSEWTDDYEGYCDLDVTYWMPLPEPPGEVEECE